MIYFGFCPNAINAWCKENNIIQNTNTEKQKNKKKKEKFWKWKWRERKREKCSFSDNGFDLFLGWIRKRNDNSCEIIGWMKAQKRAEKNISQTKLKTKKHFEGLNQFFFRFFLVLAIRFGKFRFLYVAMIMTKMMSGIESKRRSVRVCWWSFKWVRNFIPFVL